MRNVNEIGAAKNPNRLDCHGRSPAETIKRKLELK
jgi:hypothetical protein